MLIMTVHNKDIPGFEWDDQDTYEADQVRYWSNKAISDRERSVLEQAGLDRPIPIKKPESLWGYIKLQSEIKKLYKEVQAQYPMCDYKTYKKYFMKGRIDRNNGQFTETHYLMTRAALG